MGNSSIDKKAAAHFARPMAALDAIALPSSILLSSDLLLAASVFLYAAVAMSWLHATANPLSSIVLAAFGCIALITIPIASGAFVILPTMITSAILLHIFMALRPDLSKSASA